MQYRTTSVRRSRFLGFAALALASVASSSVHAQPPRPEKPAAPPSADLTDLAEKVQNPVENMFSIPLQNNTNFDIGPNHRASNILNVQPILPIALTENWNLINRFILPIGYAPDINSTTAGASGVGDLNWTGFISPSSKRRDITYREGEIMYGVGPVATFPTATQTGLGMGHWTVGPAATALWRRRPWTIGALANNQWSYAGQEGRPAVNQFYAQYFVNYNLSDGWFLTSSPIITANWKQTSGNIWTIPFGGGVGKIFKIGSQAMSAEASAFWNAASPNEGGAAWQTRLQVGFLFPGQELTKQPVATSAPSAR